MKAPTPGWSKRIPQEWCYDPVVQRSFNWLGLLLLIGCSRAGVQTTRLPDGTREVRCEHRLWRCLQHVDDYCKGGSVEVIRAGEEHLVFGSQASAVEGHRSHAVLRCLKPGEKLPEAPLAAEPLPPTPPTEASPPAPAPPAPPSPARACVPGATQACVGTAACAGGQSCLPDGSGFGPCDCGGAPAPAAGGA